jgi:hypothetical protein
MPNYSEIIYSVREAWVIPLNDNQGNYGTPEYFEYVQDVSWEPVHDNDTIKAQGVNLEELSVQIGSKIKVMEASMRTETINVITGESSSVSGASGNRVRKRIQRGGGRGNPYIGLIAICEASDGAVFVAGWPKVQAETKQKFQIEQNKFRTGEMNFKAVATRPNGKEIEIFLGYENEDDLPDFSSNTDVEAFFAEMWS